MTIEDLFRVWDTEGQVLIFDQNTKCLWFGKMFDIPYRLMGLRVSKLRGCRVYVEV